MPLNICVLASGSTGNSTAIWNDDAGLLIDCGRSCKYIEEALRRIQLDPRRLKGMLITHGHADHIGAGAALLAQEYDIPVYIHEETWNLVRERNDCRRFAKHVPHLIVHHGDEPFSVGSLAVTPFPSSHGGGNAGRTFGFTVEHADAAGRCKVGFLTDTGTTDDRMIEALLDSAALVLEANHDPEMVAKSRRHYLNRKWVLSDQGHLSNAGSAEAIIEIRRRSTVPGSPQYVFVAHMSEDHNTPLTAYTQIMERLNASRVGGIKLVQTYHRRQSAVLTVAGR